MDTPTSPPLSGPSIPTTTTTPSFEDIQLPFYIAIRENIIALLLGLLFYSITYSLLRKFVSYRAKLHQQWASNASSAAVTPSPQFPNSSSSSQHRPSFSSSSSSTTTISPSAMFLDLPDPLAPDFLCITWGLSSSIGLFCLYLFINFTRDSIYQISSSTIYLSWLDAHLLVRLWQYTYLSCHFGLLFAMPLAWFYNETGTGVNTSGYGSNTARGPAGSAPGGLGTLARIRESLKILMLVYLMAIGFVFLASKLFASDSTTAIATTSGGVGNQAEASRSIFYFFGSLFGLSPSPLPSSSSKSTASSQQIPVVDTTSSTSAWSYIWFWITSLWASIVQTFFFNPSSSSSTTSSSAPSQAISAAIAVSASVTATPSPVAYITPPTTSFFESFRQSPLYYFLFWWDTQHTIPQLFYYIFPTLTISTPAVISSLGTIRTAFFSPSNPLPPSIHAFTSLIATGLILLYSLPRGNNLIFRRLQHIAVPMNIRQKLNGRLEEIEYELLTMDRKLKRIENGFAVMGDHQSQVALMGSSNISGSTHTGGLSTLRKRTNNPAGPGMTKKSQPITTDFDFASALEGPTTLPDQYATIQSERAELLAEKSQITTMLLETRSPFLRNLVFLLLVILFVTCWLSFLFTILVTSLIEVVGVSRVAVERSWAYQAGVWVIMHVGALLSKIGMGWIAEEYEKPISSPSTSSSTTSSSIGNFLFWWMEHVAWETILILFWTSVNMFGIWGLKLSATFSDSLSSSSAISSTTLTSSSTSASTASGFLWTVKDFFGIGSSTNTSTANSTVNSGTATPSSNAGGNISPSPTPPPASRRKSSILMQQSTPASTSNNPSSNKRTSFFLLRALPSPRTWFKRHTQSKPKRVQLKLSSSSSASSSSSTPSKSVPIMNVDDPNEAIFTPLSIPLLIALVTQTLLFVTSLPFVMHLLGIIHFDTDGALLSSSGSTNEEGVGQGWLVKYLWVIVTRVAVMVVVLIAFGFAGFSGRLTRWWAMR